MEPVPKLQKPEGGQSLVEFAVSMLVLLLLVVGIADLGRALFTYLALRDAVQDGALYGSLNPTDTTGIANRVVNSSDFVSGLWAEGVLTSPTSSVSEKACMGNGITVSVTYSNFPITMPFLGAILGTQSISLSASVTDTILAPPCT